MDTSELSFEQNISSEVLPTNIHEADSSLTSQTLSTEQFHLIDQNEQPIQYELQPLEDSDVPSVN